MPEETSQTTSTVLVVVSAAAGAAIQAVTGFPVHPQKTYAERLKAYSTGGGSMAQLVQELDALAATGINFVSMDTLLEFSNEQINVIEEELDHPTPTMLAIAIAKKRARREAQYRGGRLRGAVDIMMNHLGKMVWLLKARPTSGPILGVRFGLPTEAEMPFYCGEAGLYPGKALAVLCLNGS